MTHLQVEPDANATEEDIVPSVIWKLNDRGVKVLWCTEPA